MGKIGQCCCENCDCIEGTPPTLTISGYTGAGWVSRGGCCFRQEFTPNTPSISRYCGPAISRYAIEQTCEREYYTVDNLQRACATWTNDPTYNCEDVAANCCDPQPTWVVIGSSIGTQKLTVEPHHVAFHELTRLVVYVRRDIILCDGDPVCKWMLILEYQFSYGSTIRASRKYEYAQNVESVLACHTPRPEYIGYCVDDEPIDCEDYGNLLDGCTSAGTLCVHRIKFFDDFPSGSHSFSDSDVPGLCSAPSNAMGCPDCAWDFSTIVCIEPGVYCPPAWCLNPPVIVTTPTNWQPTWGCGFFSFVTPTGCAQPPPFGCEDGFLSLCFNPTNCEGPELVLDCDSVEWPADDPEYDPPVCDGCGSGFGFGGSPFSPTNATTCSYGDGPAAMLCGCNTISPFNAEACFYLDDPCNTECCYRCFDCPGCPQCFNRYSSFLGAGFVTVGTSTISFDITCVDLTTEPDYCFSPPSISLMMGSLP